MSYTVSQNGLVLIKRFEGLRLKPYLDQVGVPTIGYGTTFYPNGKVVTMKDAAITEAQASEYLQHYIDTIIIPTIVKYVKVLLTQNQVDSLASFIYNEGSGGFAGSHLLIQINASANCAIITSEFNKWVYANHKVLDDLVIRRKLEAQLYCQQ